MILKKVHGAAGADYIALFAGACPPIGIYDARGLLVTIDFCIPQMSIGDIDKMIGKR